MRKWVENVPAPWAWILAGRPWMHTCTNKCGPIRSLLGPTNNRRLKPGSDPIPDPGSSRCLFIPVAKQNRGFWGFGQPQRLTPVYAIKLWNFGYTYSDNALSIARNEGRSKLDAFRLSLFIFRFSLFPRLTRNLLILWFGYFWERLSARALLAAIVHLLSWEKKFLKL